MAGYGIDPYMAEQKPPRRPLNKKVSKTTVYDLGERVTLDHLRALVADTQEFNGDSVVYINSGNSQRDGSWCKITINDAV